MVTVRYTSIAEGTHGVEDRDWPSGSRKVLPKAWRSNQRSTQSPDTRPDGAVVNISQRYHDILIWLLDRYTVLR